MRRSSRLLEKDRNENDKNENQIQNKPKIKGTVSKNEENLQSIPQTQVRRRGRKISEENGIDEESKQEVEKENENQNKVKSKGNSKKQKRNIEEENDNILVERQANRRSKRNEIIKEEEEKNEITQVSVLKITRTTNNKKNQSKDNILIEEDRIEIKFEEKKVEENEENEENEDSNEKENFKLKDEENLKSIQQSFNEGSESTEIRLDEKTSEISEVNSSINETDINISKERDEEREEAEEIDEVQEKIKRESRRKEKQKEIFTTPTPKLKVKDFAIQSPDYTFPVLDPNSNLTSTPNSQISDRIKKFDDLSNLSLEIHNNSKISSSNQSTPNKSNSSIGSPRSEGSVNPFEDLQFDTPNKKHHKRKKEIKQDKKEMEESFERKKKMFDDIDNFELIEMVE